MEYARFRFDPGLAHLIVPPLEGEGRPIPQPADDPDRPLKSQHLVGGGAFRETECHELVVVASRPQPAHHAAAREPITGLRHLGRYRRGPVWHAEHVGNVRQVLGGGGDKSECGPLLDGWLVAVEVIGDAENSNPRASARTVWATSPSAPTGPKPCITPRRIAKAANLSPVRYELASARRQQAHNPCPLFPGNLTLAGVSIGVERGEGVVLKGGAPK